MSDIRWRQRFQNFDQAYQMLVEALSKPTLNMLEQAGLVQIFEFTFELAWKTMKDKLFFEGFDEKTPRTVIKRAFTAGYITDAGIWLDILDKRNLLSHTYDKVHADAAVELIRNQYFSCIQHLHEMLAKQIG